MEGGGCVIGIIRVGRLIGSVSLVGGLIIEVWLCVRMLDVWMDGCM